MSERHDDPYLAHAEVQQARHKQHWRGAMHAVIAGGVHPVIDYYPEPVADKWGTVTVGEWGGYLIQIMPMIYNDRLVMAPKRAPLLYDYGWCYPKGVAAMLAALTWDPAEFGEPHGFIKRIGPVRAADTRATKVPAE